VRYLTLHELHSAKGIPAPAVLIVGEVAREHLERRQRDLLPQMLSEAKDPYSHDKFPVHSGLG
jgi:hypothetical protein